MTDLAELSATMVRFFRHAGMTVPLSSAVRLARALDDVTLADHHQLYWRTRICLASSPADIELFDEAFTHLFGQGATAAAPETAGTQDRDSTPRPGIGATADLPWTTQRTGSDSATSAVPERRPGLVRSEHPDTFDSLDPEVVRRLVRDLRASLDAWPRRRSRRTQIRHNGHRIDLRHTIARSRHTGWEMVDLIRQGQRRPARRLVVLCDVSQSMQSHAVQSLALMRAATHGTRAEVFAFGTTVTRLTPQMSRLTPEEAVARAGALVADRFGGTRIAHSLRTLLRSRHRDLLRGAVCLIVSDGWDADPPEELAAAMAQLKRRVNRIVWVNPRLDGAAYEPRAGGMAAALPYCDSVVALDGAAVFAAAAGCRST